MKKTTFLPDLTIFLNTGNCRLNRLPQKRVSPSKIRFLHKDFEASLLRAKIPGTSFEHYSLKLHFLQDTELWKICWKLDRQNWGTTFLYQTFYNASAAVFQRRNGDGRCMGFANPFCRLDRDTLYFEPSLRYHAGEEYVCDDIFIGQYSLAGKRVSPAFGVSQMESGGQFHPRYRNPGEGIALDYGEINAFNRYTAWYCQVSQKRFRFTSYNFFSNLPQRPETPGAVAAYKAHIDAASSCGVDSIILNPLCRNRVPDASPDSAWEFFPAGTVAEELYHYARSKKMEIGVYSGTAGTGEFGDSPMIEFSDLPVWKKVDCQGRLSTENCLGSDEFTEWFIQVQSNTIQKYALEIWNWDPGPGNAMFCWNQTHRHLPGRGAYWGFRNSLRVMKELKERFPGLYYQGFHGNKEYGVWGFKYIDQHEAFWENEVYTMMPIFPDLSADRCTADGIRQQSAWNYRFRFLSATLNHGLAHRMVQACYMGLFNADRLFDENGWKYALLSAIAAGGSVTLPILPHQPKKHRGYLRFYRKWIRFAKKNFRYSQFTIPFGDFPGSGIDGFSKIIKNRGFLFFFNASPCPESIDLKLDETIGFSGSGTPLYLRQIHPVPVSIIQTAVGSKYRFALPAYGVRVFQALSTPSKIVSPTKKQTPPMPRTLILRTTAPGHAETVFFAPGSIFGLLSQAALHMEEQFQEVADAYLQNTSRNNVLWSRPDRLWLWVAFDSPHHCLKSLRLNGANLPFRKEEYRFLNLSAEGLYFADVTDRILRNRNNVLEADYTVESGHILCYLHYPQSDGESIPADAELLMMRRKILWRLPVHHAPRLVKNVRILSARLNDNDVMIRNAENELVATVNLPPSELKGVYASVPISIGNTGNNLKHDMALEWKDGAWRCRFCSGERLSLIIDDDKIVLWAVTRRQTESSGYELPIQWELPVLPSRKSSGSS